jgi:hypothetical protein
VLLVDAEQDARGGDQGWFSINQTSYIEYYI